MGTNFAKHLTVVPQTEPLRADQVKNNAGGYGWQVDKWTQLDRFLVLGSEGGTYYTSERKLTKDNYNALTACLAEDGLRAVNRIVEISDAGRAPKNDYAIFALALACSDTNDKTRAAALAAIPKVCRIGTHLFHFAEFVQGFRGWGRGLRRAIGAWYQSKTEDDLAYQLVKYKQRDGWSHRDLLRLSHPQGHSESMNALLKYAVTGKAPKPKYLPEILDAAERLKTLTGEQAALVIASCNLPREAVPTELLNDPLIWEALLQSMPMTAMIRNLAKMTAIGLLKPFSSQAKKVADQLTDVAALKKARVHPIQVLSALMVYQQGHGEKGNLSWTPIDSISVALDEAFHLAFGNVTPSGKRLVLGLDVSGSMDGSNIVGVPGLTARLGAAAMALVTARTESQVQLLAFSSKLIELEFSSDARLNDIVNAMRRMTMGATDCSLPIVTAMRQGWDVDAFITYTDSETFAGDIHPAKALQNYNERKGSQARNVVVGMCANNFTIADPKNKLMLDVVGFDTATPEIISAFSRGDF